MSRHRMILAVLCIGAIGVLVDFRHRSLDLHSGSPLNADEPLHARVAGELVSPDLKDWTLTIRANGGLPREQKALGTYEATVYADGKKARIEKVRTVRGEDGSRKSVSEVLFDGELSKEESVSLFDSVRKGFNGYRLSGTHDVWGDGWYVIVKLQTLNRSVELTIRDMESPRVVGTEIAKCLAILDSHLQAKDRLLERND